MDDLSFWFHPEASAEVFAAHDRYFDVRAELAEDFAVELERSREVIARNPQAWPAYLFGTQRYLMKQFPFFIVFRVTDVRIEIIAVAHERQRPGYGSDRSAG